MMNNRKENWEQWGVREGLIKFDEDQKRITYIDQNKNRNYDNPEEEVQAKTFIKLIQEYDYPSESIRQFVSVTMGSTIKEADIIVYEDEELQSPYIVVECKEGEVSEGEFSQAVNQAFSYAVAEGAKYVWITSGIKDEYYRVAGKRPKSRIPVPDIPRYGASQPEKYKYVKGGIGPKEGKFFELRTISEGELTRRFKQAHNALWGGGELNPSTAFDELDKLIFCKLWDERRLRQNGEPYDFQIFSEATEEKTNKELLKRINILYEEGREKDPEMFKESIRLSPERLRTVVSYLEPIDLSKTDLDSKGRAFETFMGSFFRGDFGQYFTPRAIVKFIVDTLPIKNDSLVLDTSCGSGGFLLHALDKIRQQANEYEKEDTLARYKYWHNFAEKNLFGIEINEQIARAAKMNMIIHDDGHTNVITIDGLLPSNDKRDENGNLIEGIISQTKNQGFKYNRFNFIITNPPFGSVIKQTEKAYMHQYRTAWKGINWLDPRSKMSRRANQGTEILFIEQCYNFLIAGGYLAIVIPDGILTNSSLQYVRNDIEEWFRIIAIISLPQTAFQSTGAGVKSSVLFLKKHDKNTTENIRNKKAELQDKIKLENDYLERYQKIEDDKKQCIKELQGFSNPQNLKGEKLKKSESYKEWKKQINDQYKEKIDNLKKILIEQYLQKKRKILDDYPIFMAVTEDIGYDATGRPTGNNELDVICEELARFIDAVERGKT